MKAIDDYRYKIEMLKKQNLLSDAVKIFLAGMIVTDSDLNIEEKIKLRDELGFNFDKYGAVGEAAIFGDIVDFKGQRIDYTLEELFKKKM